MLTLPGLRARTSIRHHRMVGQRLKGQGLYELRCRPGHDDVHIRAHLAQAGNDLAGLIGCDAAGHAKDNGLALQIHLTPRDS